MWSSRTSRPRSSSVTPTASNRSSAPNGRHRTDLLLLSLVQAVVPGPGAQAARLDLAEDDRGVVLVGQDEIELAEPGPVVACEHAVAEP
jgi:hypothetical protein